MRSLWFPIVCVHSSHQINRLHIVDLQVCSRWPLVEGQAGFMGGDLRGLKALHLEGSRALFKAMLPPY